MSSDLIDLCRVLIAYPSVTPYDGGCQHWIADYLTKLGFDCAFHPTSKVTNLWARYGDEEPLFVFAGHTDVVTPGPLADWRADPFTLTLEEDTLMGRGIADMKGAIAAMLHAISRRLADPKPCQGSIAVLLTSAEEGEDFAEGTPYVLQQLAHPKITWCLVGEPSCHQSVGDTLKIGRRGSLNAQLRLQGKQGHVAYPQLADNPIHRAAQAMQALLNTTWDQGHPGFPDTALQISAITAGDGSTNVIPEECRMQFNFRFSPASSATTLQEKVHHLLDQQGCQYTIDWRLSGEPFYSHQGRLLDDLLTSIAEVCQTKPAISTDGGTSDARFIAPHCAEVIEFGLPNHSIHQINEHIRREDLLLLAEIYYRLLDRLLS